MRDSFYWQGRGWRNRGFIIGLERLGPPRLVHSAVVPDWKLRALRARRPHPWIVWLAFARTVGRCTCGR